MKMSNAVFRLIFKPRVLHRLPGRLRVHLPWLKKVTGNRSEIIDLLTALFTVPDQIREVSTDHVSGNILILYDAASVKEDEVLGYLSALFEVILRNRERLEAQPADRLYARRGQLVEFVKTSLDGSLGLNPHLTVPQRLLTD